MSDMVAALYVETNGVYFGLPDVDPWDEQRDARLYAGPWPVVAHPPCARWCQLARLVESLYGYRVGDDGGSFAAALASVRAFGGILEHPAYSIAWAHHDLPRPTRGMWVQSLLDPGWVTEISQIAYGHLCRKRTWLYYVGTEPPAPVRWEEPISHFTISDLGPGGSRRRKGTWIAGVQAGPSSATPPAFRDVLLAIARSASLSDKEGT